MWFQISHIRWKIPPDAGRFHQVVCMSRRLGCGKRLLKLYEKLTGGLIGRLAGALIKRLVGRLIQRLIGRLIGRLIEMLVDGGI